MQQHDAVVETTHEVRVCVAKTGEAVVAVMVCPYERIHAACTLALFCPGSKECTITGAVMESEYAVFDFIGFDAARAQVVLGLGRARPQ